MFLGILMTLIVSTRWGLIFTPSFETMCTSSLPSYIEKGYFLGLSDKPYFWNLIKVFLRCFK
jgi:hypothetical protein